MWEKMTTQYLSDAVIMRRAELEKLRKGKPKWDLMLRAKSSILREMEFELATRSN